VARKQELRLSTDSIRSSYDELPAPPNHEVGNAEPMDGSPADGSGDPVTDEIGPAATVRYQRAKLRVMEQEMEKLVEENKEKTGLLEEGRTTHKTERDELTRLQRHIKAVENQSEKYRKLAEYNAKKLDTAELELAAAQKEVEIAARTSRTTKGDISTKDVRLNRALEELEKYKTLMRERQVEEQDKKMDIKREVERLARGMMLQSFFDGPHLSLHTLELTMAR